MISTVTPTVTITPTVTATPIVVPPSSRLKIEVLDENQLAAPGDEMNYTVNLYNEGPAIAESIIVDITLPDGLTYVADNPGSGTEGWTCSYSMLNLTCERSAIAVGTAPPIVLSIRLPSKEGMWTVSARARAANLPPDLQHSVYHEFTITTTPHPPERWQLFLPDILKN